MIVRCAACEATYPETTPLATCSACDGLLAVEHDPLTRTGAQLRAQFDDRMRIAALTGSAVEQSGVWRFHELVHPAALAAAVSHPEGNTPLLARAAITRHAGVEQLWVKHEGHNPSGSFKDRGMTVAVTQALRVGARAVACASTGNTSASLSAYAAQAGIPAFVLVPAGRVASGKLAQTIAYGARVLHVDGDFDDCLRLTRAAAAQLGVYLVNSVNPFRIEGQKTIVFELLQQLRWSAPDWIALPAGNLGNTAAFGKALREAFDAGLIDRIPRLLAVQASGAAPFARAFQGEFTERLRVRAETAATAIRIGDPASWDRGVRAIRDTNGEVVAVSDDEIFAAKRVVDEAGVGCEPASAASIAGVRTLVARGIIGMRESVVAVLTGHLLKDPDAVMRIHAQDGDVRVLAVGEVLDELERVLAER